MSRAQLIMTLRMILTRGTPAALKAVSSSCSPMLPKEMSEVSSTAMGNAIGTSERAIYQKNWASTSMPRPLPTRSLTCFHTNCIINTNRQMQKQPKKSRKNFLSTKVSIFFMPSIQTAKVVNIFEI